MLSFGTPFVDVAGLDFNSNPPDAVGAVGPNHYIQLVNATNYRIHDKTGAIVQNTRTLDSLGSGVCASGRGDPIALYDQFADRWLLSEFGSGNNLCIYISQTPDPTGAFFQYSVTAPTFPDYPKYAVSNDAYFIGTNESANPVYALPRAQMLAGPGGTISAIRRTTTDRPNWQRNQIMPVDVDGPAPPAGAPGLFVRQIDDEITNPGGANPTNDFLEIWEFHPDFATPANSTYSLANTISISEFDYNLCNWDRNCLSQPGTDQKIDALPHYIGWRAQYRNFGSYETLLVSFTTDVAVNRAGVRWVEMRKTAVSSWGVHQEGTVSLDTDSRWMSSIAMNGQGDIALMYNVTSSSTSPSIRYIGRRASDPLGTMPQGEYALPGGTGVGGVTTGNRWGDYSSMSVDPADDRSFWFTGMYSQGNGTSATRIGAVSFDLLGDFNVDGAYSCEDIDDLIAEIAAGTNDPSFDLNDDALVDVDDRDMWLATAGEFNLGPGKAYLLGDATLNGVVDGLDFTVWNANKFTNVAAWCSGDFSANGVVDGVDFTLWNANKFTESDVLRAMTKDPSPALVQDDQSDGQFPISFDAATDPTSVTVAASASLLTVIDFDPQIRYAGLRDKQRTSEEDTMAWHDGADRYAVGPRLLINSLLGKKYEYRDAWYE